MAPPLTIPKSWRDKSLLDDPVILDPFTVRNFHTGPTRRRIDERWITELAEEIINKPEYLPAAVRWSEYAFQCEGQHASPKTESVDHSSLESVLLFVRFYWTWFRDGDKRAVSIVNNVRKKRGFVYRLPEIGQEERLAIPEGPPPDTSQVLPDVAPTSDDGERLVSNVVAEETDVSVIDREYVGSEEDKCGDVVFGDAEDVDRYIAGCSDAGHAQPQPMDVVEPCSATEAESPSSTLVGAMSPPSSKAVVATEKNQKTDASMAHADAAALVLQHDKLPQLQPPNNFLRRQQPNPTRLSRWATTSVRDEQANTMLADLPHTHEPLPDRPARRSHVSILVGSAGEHQNPHTKSEPSKRRKKTKKTTKNDDSSRRPAKRRRRKKGEDVNECQGQLEQHPHAVQMQTVQASTSTALVHSTKRKHDSTSGAPGLPAEASSTSGTRRTIKLPQRKGGHNDGVVVPLPSKTSLGIPASLREADQMLQGLATDALLSVSNPTTVAVVWSAGPDPQEDSPSSDEEDIPLQRSVAAKRPCRDMDNQSVAMAQSRPQPGSAAHFNPYAPQSHPRNCNVRYESPMALATNGQFTMLPNLVGTRLPTPATPHIPKSPLTAQPIIWAKSRQEVCESLDWFRSYQGGVYSNHDIVKGYLLSGFSASRDIFARDGRLIISHGGGKAESLHSINGKIHVQEASDQHESDKSVRALLRTWQLGRPLALLIDDRYALFPYDLTSKKDCTYVVLGFYHIACIWAERQPVNEGRSVVRYKIAFEWCEKQPAPWWIQHNVVHAPDPGDVKVLPSPSPARRSLICAMCQKPSPLVYEEGWMCLQPQCKAFWQFPDSLRPPNDSDLHYDESFLGTPFLQCDHEILEDIAPQPPATNGSNGVVTSSRFSKGWHCKMCGRLSCRFKWQHWECQHCGDTVQVAGKTRMAKEFWGQTNSKFLNHHVIDPDIQASPLRPFRADSGHNGHYHVYTLPQNRGKIYLVLGKPLINNIADDIFQDYQQQAESGELQFRRFPLRNHQCRGELLTNYFSQNSGEPYQYVGGTGNTVPFHAAPSAVLKARDLIQSRMMSVMAAEGRTTAYQFNEVLSAAYMEEQSMSFHSDAEDGLGPRVASLSLGSCAYMHFRLLKKYRNDCGKFQTRNCLTLFLRHGDVLIMDGAAIQEYYEHTVVPLNFRIAATARYIGGRTH